MNENQIRKFLLVILLSVLCCFAWQEHKHWIMELPVRVKAKVKSVRTKKKIPVVITRSSNELNNDFDLIIPSHRYTASPPVTVANWGTSMASGCVVHPYDDFPKDKAKKGEIWVFTGDGWKGLGF